jgi:hypothetical protein
MLLNPNACPFFLDTDAMQAKYCSRELERLCLLSLRMLQAVFRRLFSAVALLRGTNRVSYRVGVSLCVPFLAPKVRSAGSWIVQTVLAVPGWAVSA